MAEIRKEYLENFISTYKLYQGQSLHVAKVALGFISTHDYLYLMERVNSMADTDYFYLIELNRDEAEWLVSQKIVGGKTVTEWMDALK